MGNVQFRNKNSGVFDEIDGEFEVSTRERRFFHPLFVEKRLFPLGATGCVITPNGSRRPFIFGVFFGAFFGSSVAFFFVRAVL